ncbi:hypothetical protein DFR59_101453 [Falsibacillus pallidus]|uniref:Uncharacterized protein n=1 Tax=Falsibacillus pallidus TaxID=493781 RepID=A0A370GVT8_9BACI|nr:hypothetical protein DFR59_101453 [Falsibacillus pallidus]
MIGHPNNYSCSTGSFGMTAGIIKIKIVAATANVTPVAKWNSDPLMALTTYVTISINKKVQKKVQMYLISYSPLFKYIYHKM